MKSRVLTLCVLMLLPVLALAQASTPPPPGTPHARGGDVFYVRTNRPGDLGAWWKDSEIVRQLQLSDAQIKQVEQTFLDARLKLIDLRADVERQETLLQPLMDADQIDNAKIRAQMGKVLAARINLEMANAMMMVDIRSALTTEQWKKLQAIQQSREQEHRMAPPARPGMPGPPQGPGPGPGPATAPPPPGDDDL